MNALVLENTFEALQRRAWWLTLWRQLTGRPAGLCTLQAASAKYSALGSGPRTLREVPVARITGTVGQAQAYTPEFLPRRLSDALRWARMRRLLDAPEGWPPIELIELGGHYFVEDGHHRVSVARYLGFKQLEAYVTPLHPVSSMPLAACLC